MPQVSATLYPLLLIASEPEIGSNGELNTAWTPQLMNHPKYTAANRSESIAQ